VMFTITNLMFLDARVLLALSASVLPLWILSRVRAKTVFVMISGYLFFLGGVTLSQGISPVGHLFDHELRVLINFGGGVQLTVEGLQVGLSRSLRMANPLLFGLWVGMTTEPTMIARALMKMRVPVEIAFMFLTALRLLPLVTKRAQEVRNAQAIRGASRNIVRRVQSMLFPLFLTSIQSARTMGLTMECRAFSVKAWDEFLRDIKFGLKDISLVLYGISIMAVGVWILYFSGWSVSTIGNAQ
jgi:energy-coupling factor transport system permease protein